MLASATSLLVGTLVTVAILAGAVVVAVMVAWRRTRRRLERIRRSAGVRTLAAVVGAVRAPSIDGSSPARLRVRLWQSVASATQAVRTAGTVAGPAGDLGRLARRLHDAADDLDPLLAMAAGLSADMPVVADLRQQVGEVLQASAAIRLAALASAGDTVSLRVRRLAEDAGRELQAVDAGVARAKSALSPG